MDVSKLVEEGVMCGMCEIDGGRMFSGCVGANYRKKYVVSGGFTVNDLITLRFHAPQTTPGSGVGTNRVCNRQRGCGPPCTPEQVVHTERSCHDVVKNEYILPVFKRAQIRGYCSCYALKWLFSYI